MVTDTGSICSACSACFIDVSSHVCQNGSTSRITSLHVLDVVIKSRTSGARCHVKRRKCQCRFRNQLLTSMWCAVCIYHWLSMAAARSPWSHAVSFARHVRCRQIACGGQDNYPGLPLQHAFGKGVQVSQAFELVLGTSMHEQHASATGFHSRDARSLGTESELDNKQDWTHTFES